MPTVYINSSTILPGRAEYDLYSTNLGLVMDSIRLYRPGKITYVLDPGAGDGRWGATVKMFEPECFLTGVEVRNVPHPDLFDRWVTCDFQKYEHPPTFDFIVGNPPFGDEIRKPTLAERFIRKGWELLRPGGRMMFMLSLDFICGEDRFNGLWNDIPLSQLVVLSNRPSFNGETGGAPNNCALFIWDKRPDGTSTGKSRKFTAELMIYRKAGK